MHTQILSKFDLLPAVNCLKRGSLAIFPTETVYGLGASIFNPKAIQKIFLAKKRPNDNPLIAHVSSREEAESIACTLDTRFYTLVEAFWPGPLAIVVKKNGLVPLEATGGLESIAIRMPSNPIALDLIRRVKEPLVAPSANLSGKPSPTKLLDALEDLDGVVEYAIDGGECLIGIESTVISLLGEVPILLRPGKISIDAIENVLKCKVKRASKNSPTLSPGMKYRHYAPKANLELVYKREDLGPEFIEPSQEKFYQQLREIDRQKIQTMQVYVSDSVKNDEALMNRLLRAAGEIV